MGRDDALPVCPECQQGNCDGTTWNPITDAEDDCPCALRGHA
jgi:hypothetical protein